VGAALATHAYEAGRSVVATARRPETLSYLPDDPRVLKLALDVTSQDQVSRPLDTAVKKFGRVDVVVNNAFDPFSVAQRFKVGLACIRGFI
jgi:NADP-dependent 3-hydroxy acid dehydrogenase YdfG